MNIDEMLEAVKKNANSDPLAAKLPKEVNLKAAKKVIYAVESAAAKMGVRVVIAVVNGGANLVALEAMDGSYIASIRVAQDKAYTAMALKMPTQKALEESRGGSLDGLTNGNGILLLGGGEPLVCGNEIVGAVGVSGGTKDEDMALAKIGAEVFRLS